MTEERSPDSRDLQLIRRGPRRQQCALAGVELLSRPRDAVSKRLRNLGDVATREEGSHHPIAVAMNEMDGQIERCQARQRFAWHRPRQHVPADHDSVGARRAHVLERRFERREVSMDVV